MSRKRGYAFGVFPVYLVSSHGDARVKHCFIPFAELHSFWANVGAEVSKLDVAVDPVKRVPETTPQAPQSEWIDRRVCRKAVPPTGFSPLLSRFRRSGGHVRLLIRRHDSQMGQDCWVTLFTGSCHGDVRVKHCCAPLLSFAHSGPTSVQTYQSGVAVEHGHVTTPDGPINTPQAPE